MKQVSELLGMNIIDDEEDTDWLVESLVIIILLSLQWSAVDRHCCTVREIYAIEILSGNDNDDYV